MEKKLDEYIAADKREDPLSQLARVRAEMEAEDRAKKEKEEKEKQEAARREREANEPPAPPKVDPHHLQQLCDMGFARAHAEEALEACGNELNAAMEWIFSHPATEVSVCTCSVHTGAFPEVGVGVCSACSVHTGAFPWIWQRDM